MHYEYKIEEFKDRGFLSGDVKWNVLEVRLNKLAAAGWEVQHIQALHVGGAGSGTSGTVLFLRRVVS